MNTNQPPAGREVPATLVDGALITRQHVVEAADRLRNVLAVIDNDSQFNHDIKTVLEALDRPQADAETVAEDRDLLDWFLSTPGSIPELTTHWLRLESPLGSDPYQDPRIGGRAALRAAMLAAIGAARAQEGNKL
jgi:hypothetical protein